MGNKIDLHLPRHSAFPDWLLCLAAALSPFLELPALSVQCRCCGVRYSISFGPYSSQSVSLPLAYM